MLIVKLTNAQTIKLAPVNTDFKSFIDNKISTNLKSGTIRQHRKGLNPSPFKPNFSNKIKSLLKSSSIELETSYDLRLIDNGNYLTNVKNQGNSGTCWTFATYGSIESYLLKNNIGNYDFSEQNLATCHGFDWGPDDGGNIDISTSYLSRHLGPINEIDDPYTEPDNSETCTENLTPQLFIENARYLPGINEDAFDMELIKEAIVNYGALYTNMNYDDDCYNSDDYTYYYEGSDYTNHAVLLVGWDDNKTVTAGSRNTPSSPGAWIIRNSWGSDWGEDGFFYISYEDTKALSTVAYFPSSEPYSASENVYFYDKCGMVGAIGDGETTYALIKYTTSNTELLEKLGITIPSNNAEVSFEIYESFDGTDLTGFLGEVSTQSCEYPGFYTFDISESSIILNSNSDFYIKAKVTTPNYDYPIAIEYQYEGYSGSATIEQDKCWVSADAELWEAIGIGTDSEFDICIKAYTNSNPNSLIPNFSSDTQYGSYPLTINFTDLSNGDITGWEWDFNNDGIVDSYEQNPSFTYTEKGTYSVTLTITDDSDNNSITKNDLIEVYAPEICNDLSTEYDIDFENTEIMRFWSINDNNSDNATWTLDTENGLNSSTCYNYSSNLNNAADDWLISSCFDLYEDQFYQLNFYTKAENKYYPEKLAIYLIQNDDINDNPQLVTNLEDISSTSFSGTTANFSPITNGSYRIAFKCYSDANTRGLYLDDISLKMQTVLSINEIQETDDISGDSPFKDQIVFTEGIITSISENSEYGTYIQDEENIWSGIKTNLSNSSLSQGDKIIVQGIINESSGLTEINSIDELKVVSSNNSINPISLDIENIDESYESVLVQLTNVHCSQTSFLNEWKISDGTNELIIDNSFYDYNPGINENFTSITGIITYNKNDYRLLIRNEDDIKSTPTEITNSIKLSDINVYPNPTSDFIKIEISNNSDLNYVTTNIYNIVGKKIFSKYIINTDVIDLDLSSYSNGIYLIELISNKGSKVFRISKE